MDFVTDFLAFRQRMKQDMEEAFHLHEDFDALGQRAALYGSFSMDEEKRIFGLMSTKSFTHAHEYRFLFSDQAIDEARLQSWWDKAVALEEAFVMPDAAHEFSLVSLIVVTDSFPKALQRKLKKFKAERMYRNEGWSSIRLAVVDLSQRQIYTNNLGSPLKNVLLPCLKNG